MPGIDGFEVTRAIRAIPARAEVVLVTGSVTDLERRWCAQRGAGLLLHHQPF